MTEFADSYWQWASRSKSVDRAERKEAERDAGPHLAMVERLGDGVDSAAKAIKELLEGPETLADWQVSHLCYGPLSDAVADHGTDFLSLSPFLDGRGRRLADDWLRSNS